MHPSYRPCPPLRLPDELCVRCRKWPRKLQSPLCPDCYAEEQHAGLDDTCPGCGGEGEAFDGRQVGAARYFKCKICNGSGKHPARREN